MAKKSFNISSTLKKNTPEIQLAPKIELRKKPKDPELIVEKVNEIHEVNTLIEGKVEQIAPTEKKQLVESLKPKKKEKKAVTEEKIVRLTIDTPSSMHKRLKIKSIERGVSMRDLILRLIEKEISK